MSCAGFYSSTGSRRLQEIIHIQDTKIPLRRVCLYALGTRIQAHMCTHVHDCRSARSVFEYGGARARRAQVHSSETVAPSSKNTPSITSSIEAPPDRSPPAISEGSDDGRDGQSVAWFDPWFDPVVPWFDPADAKAAPRPAGWGGSEFLEILSEIC